MFPQTGRKVCGCSALLLRSTGARSPGVCLYSPPRPSQPSHSGPPLLRNPRQNSHENIMRVFVKGPRTYRLKRTSSLNQAGVFHEAMQNQREVLMGLFKRTGLSMSRWVSCRFHVRDPKTRGQVSCILGQGALLVATV